MERHFKNVRSICCLNSEPLGLVALQPPCGRSVSAALSHDGKQTAAEKVKAEQQLHAALW